jgi:periplasmic protein TonB
MQRKTDAPLIGRWYAVFRHPHAPPAALALSVAAHALLLSALAGSSGPTSMLEEEPAFRPVFYLPPPNRPITEPGTEVRLEWVALGTGGSGGAPVAAAVEGDPVRTRDRDSGVEGNQTPDPGTSASDEPVYTVIEVHEEAVRVATSAAPAYPPQLLSEGIEGSVLVRYVVDADGTPDVSSFRVISMTRREFADAVREALPHMRFTPARIDERPVRQLVEQPFSFRIRRPMVDTTSLETAQVPQ